MSGMTHAASVGELKRVRSSTQKFEHGRKVTKIVKLEGRVQPAADGNTPRTMTCGKCGGAGHNRRGCK